VHRLSVYIIAYNEADKIADAVRSVSWADEVIVADSHSTDGTAELAASLGARVVQVPFTGFGALRNEAVRACSHDWVFSLDSDERCTLAVRDEIRGLLSQPQPAHDAYLVPRRNYFLGREIKHSGWYPNYRQPQLFRRDSMRYDESPVHEGYEMLRADATLGRLRQAIWQLPYKDLAEVINKMNRYSTLGAAKPRQAGSSFPKALGHGAWAFLRHYVFNAGFLDGWAGFVIAFANFEGTFYRYAKAVELTRRDEWTARWKNVV
jgi:glycosyltransferase involved in cell wall biosynthesis